MRERRERKEKKNKTPKTPKRTLGVLLRAVSYQSICSGLNFVPLKDSLESEALCLRMTLFGNRVIERAIKIEVRS